MQVGLATSTWEAVLESLPWETSGVGSGANADGMHARMFPWTQAWKP